MFSSLSLIDQAGFENPEFADASSGITVFDLEPDGPRWLRTPEVADASSEINVCVLEPDRPR